MSENAVEVGQRIRRIRERRGWSQGQLAALLSRTQTAISYWEAGRRALGIDDLVSLAQTLGVSPAELLPDSRPPRSVSALLRAVAEQVDAQQLADDLEKFALAAEDLPSPPVKWQVPAASPRDTAETLLATAGIVEPPIPVRELVIGCGVRILAWSFKDIDGLTVELTTGAVVWINPEQAETRQRFTMAHELGHHLLRHTDKFHVDFGGELSPSTTGSHPGYDWRAERAANDFAADLLMPAALVRSAFANTGDLKSLAKQFNVSPAAIGFRLKNLRLG